MIYGIYSIKDEKTGFMPVTVDTNDKTAIRNFSFAVNKPDSLLKSNSNDFSLWKLGEFDTDTGMLDPCKSELVDAASVIKE